MARDRRVNRARKRASKAFAAENRELVEQARENFERSFLAAVQRLGNGSYERLHANHHGSTQPVILRRKKSHSQVNIIRDTDGRAYIFSARKREGKQSKLRATYLPDHDGIILRGLGRQNGNRLRISRYGFQWVQQPHHRRGYWAAKRDSVNVDRINKDFPILKGLL